MRRLCVLVVLALLVAPAFADIVHLKNGGRVEGAVTDLGDSYRITHRFGTVVIPKSDVTGIEKKAGLKELHAERRKTIDVENPDDLVGLGKWCRENGWESQAKKEFAAALALDPHHRGAHTALGHVFFEGAWRTEREIMERRGFVLYKGQWLTREEVALIKAREAEIRRVRNIERKLNRLFRKLAGGDDRGRERAFKDLVTMARQLDNPALEKFAGEAKAYYDRAWEIVRSQMAILEIRAQVSSLKRPIPTFQTSLGAGSTPVTMQLPELSVISLGTTVVVPVGR